MIEFHMTGIEIFDNALPKNCLTSTPLLIFQAARGVLTTSGVNLDKPHGPSEEENLIT